MASVRGNPDKLHPVRSKREASEKGKKGGLASGAARRERATFRKLFDDLLSCPSDELEGMDNKAAIAIAQIRKAALGDTKAAEFVRDTIGEKPTDKVDNTIAGNLEIAWKS